MAADVQPLTALAFTQLAGEPRLGALEGHQQVLLQRLPLAEVLLERLGAGRREAGIPVFRSSRAVPHVWILLAELARGALSFAHPVRSLALQARQLTAATTVGAALLAGRALTPGLSLLRRRRLRGLGARLSRLLAGLL